MSSAAPSASRCSARCSPPATSRPSSRTLAGLPPELAEPASEGIGAAFAVAAQAGDQGPTIIDAAKHAFVDGWVQSMWLGVGMAAVALVYLIVRGPARVTHTVPVRADELVEVG